MLPWPYMCNGGELLILVWVTPLPFLSPVVLLLGQDRIACILVNECLWWRVVIRFPDCAVLICTCWPGMPACFPILCIVRLHWEWELVWALGCKLDDLESLHVGFRWWKRPLRLLWVSRSVVSNYTCQRRTGEAMQWELSASWEERKR